MNQIELKEFLDHKANKYESVDFIDTDPIKIPHQFSQKEDIEISGFLVASISWGNRITIIKSGERMIQLLGDDPYNFIMSHSDKELNQLSSFVHRTFNGTDFIFFIKALKHIYKNHGGLEYAFSNKPEAKRMNENISYFKKIFFELPHNKRTQKHVSDPFKGSAAKRLNMYLRWMVRSSKSNVDFGIWKRLSPCLLYTSPSPRDS